MQIPAVTIIGAGPAGLFAAAHIRNRKVVVLEKNSRPGKKLLISGSGRCNLTHEGPIGEFKPHYGLHGSFLKHAFFTFTNQDLIRFFSSRGLPLVTDKNGKVFPASQDAKDVLRILLLECQQQGAEIITGKDGLTAVDEGLFPSPETPVLLSTGGLSYPGTGSTGDGYLLARRWGHPLVDTGPALTPVTIRDYLFTEMAGISLNDRVISLYRDNRKIATHQGDIGFTHQGLSGPGILDFSRYMKAGDTLKINLIGLSQETFRNHFLETYNLEGKKSVQRFFMGFGLPKNLIKTLLFHAGVEPEIPVAAIDRKTRLTLENSMCDHSFVIGKLGGYETAMVTRGGVSITEVDPKTMESKIVPGLYFAGEILDIDGDTGGYNLQAAFSTGYLAAKNLSERKV